VIHPDRSEIAWAAGLFEGEGCTYPNHRKDRPNPVPVMCLSTTDKDVLERFVQVVGVGPMSARSKKQPQYKQQWVWTISGFERVQAIGAAFWPWLGERRRAQWVRTLDAYR